MEDPRTMDGAELREELRRLEAVLAFDTTGRTAELERGIGRLQDELERRRTAQLWERDARA